MPASATPTPISHERALGDSALAASVLDHEANETAKFWKAEEFDSLELLRARYIRHRFSPHTHPTFAIAVITYGIETFQLGRQNHAALAGTLALVNPGEVHTGQAGDGRGWKYCVFYPSIAVMQRAATLVADKPQPVPYFPTPVVQDEPVAGLLLQLHQTLEHSISPLERESRFLWAMGQLVQRHGAVRPATGMPKDRRAIQRARDYLEFNYSQPITLEQLAGQAHLSPFHFLRVFRDVVGLPPHAYLTQMRVLRAKQLLAVGNPIIQVAQDVGFVDQSHLNKHFKRIVGVTPKQYADASADTHFYLSL